MRDRWQMVGKEIRAARLERGWSQTDLAEILELRQWHVTRDERGPAHGIDSGRLARYIEILGLDRDRIEAIIFGPDRGGDDLELQVKLRAAAAIPGLSDVERREIEEIIRSRHVPSRPPRRGRRTPPPASTQAPESPAQP
jgi:transcriptional regulator with XRE-family HTH domain